MDRNAKVFISICYDYASPSSRRAWIEILAVFGTSRVSARSPSSRRAWIEIFAIGNVTLLTFVALLAEGVDRNFTIMRG